MLLILSLTLSILITLFFGLGLWPLIWIIYPLIVVAFILWMIPLKWPNRLWVTISFVWSSILSIAGIFLGASFGWMFLTASFSLAGWNIQNLYLDQNKSADPGQIKLIIRSNVFLIGVVIALSLIIQFFGKTIQFQLPFWAVIILTCVFVFCLDWVWRFLES